MYGIFPYIWLKIDGFHVAKYIFWLIVTASTKKKHLSFAFGRFEGLHFLMPEDWDEALEVCAQAPDRGTCGNLEMSGKFWGVPFSTLQNKGKMSIKRGFFLFGFQVGDSCFGEIVCSFRSGG